VSSPVSESDRRLVSAQLGRPARAIASVAHRCPCGKPDVVTTEPRLPDGTPFPTLYYLTCPIATGRVGTLEASGLMAEMTRRLAEDPALADRYRAAHERYLAERAELADRVGLGTVPEIDGVSAGGMPTRVKCLHVLVGHSLAAGPGVNPLGDEAIAAISEWWTADRCYCEGAWDTAGEAPSRDLSRHGPQGLPEIVGRPAPVRKSKTDAATDATATEAGA
jgi:uncharacterized protein